MNERATSSTSDVSLKAFMLNVVLWLPLAFFLWFYLAGLLVLPVQWLLSGVLELFHGDLFEGIGREHYWLQIGALIELPEGRAVADIPINPMIYGYGLPLVAGLAVSTRSSVRWRLAQLGLAFVAVALVQVWGAYWELFRTLAFSMGAPGVAVAEQAGLGREIIALCYQFGYLVLPAVVPIALWILMNRNFIEGVIGTGSEPPAHKQGQ